MPHTPFPLCSDALPRQTRPQAQRSPELRRGTPAGGQEVPRAARAVWRGWGESSRREPLGEHNAVTTERAASQPVPFQRPLQPFLLRQVARRCRAEVTCMSRRASGLSAVSLTCLGLTSRGPTWPCPQGHGGREFPTARAESRGGEAGGNHGFHSHAAPWETCPFRS